ncbi:M48 family metalloprotease [Rhodovulum kholense]|uniref:Putative Zn-dependent protease n=1 Tax=Rhodovulum kholense TaxID=453584 RepID=A0A8E2VKE8_9RHOB|nr:M48 family metalloprotease [Rhodovulum kholense]PTW49795.1 putative Zn-dependent protease [Rhodovulum kholense]
MAAMTGLARGLAGLALALIVLLAPLAARAQSLIRDAEIEYALKRLTQPLAVAAGLSPQRVRVMVLQDSSLNAFVLDGQTIMIHSGLLLRLESAAELQAVISHELAHIANGHITRRLANIRGAGSAAGMGLLMSLAVAATGNADAAAGLAMGTSSTAQRLLFAHTRAEESSADQSGARYMARAGISPQAMVDVLEMFRGQEALSESRQDPYVRTHPLHADRLRSVRGYASAYKGTTQPDAEADYWFARARGKLGAFLQSPRYTLRRAEKDKTAIGMMRRAVAWHRTPDAKRAMAELARLEAAQGGDPFVQELKGQILLESRQFGPAAQAYARAVQMAPNEPLILAGYGRALLALDRPGENRRALDALEKARARDPFDPRMLRDLAVAYARTGNNGMASVATAERYAIMGRMDTAGVHARRAEGLLPRGSPGWLRADDIVAAAERSARK